MPTLYNQLHVDEQYSRILEPNLFTDAIFVPGVTCTDEYQTGAAGKIYVRKLKTSAAEPGKPGRDFSDESAQDELIPITINNDYMKSKKIYGVQAAAVSIPLGNENLSLATQECGAGRQVSAFACLIQEGKATTETAAVAEGKPREDAIATRKEIVSAKGKADICLCHPDYYAEILKVAGKDFLPSTNERVTATGNVGVWLGITFFECPDLTSTEGKYYDHADTLKTVSFANVDYIMYNHKALSILSNFEAARLIDAENFVGAKAQVELNCGFRVTNPELVRVRKHV